jgi:hypothetical protein
MHKIIFFVISLSIISSLPTEDKERKLMRYTVSFNPYLSLQIIQTFIPSRNIYRRRELFYKVVIKI